MDKVITPMQSPGNGGEVSSEQFITSNPGVNPYVKESDFATLNKDAHGKTTFNPGTVQS